MKETICALHIHSTYSDGTGTYDRIAAAAANTGVDVAIVTDHNVLVEGLEGYYADGHKPTLLLTGEEIHDQNRNPQANHLLVFGAGEEMASFASEPQQLLTQINKRNGLSFLAHPYEYLMPAFHEEAINWIDWDVNGFTGLELWNSFSEFKTVSHNLRETLFHAIFPEFIPHGPLPQALKKWDELLTAGAKIFVVAGSDAHALRFQRGFFRKTIFPYEYHFAALRNHLLLDESFSGDLKHDRKLVYDALRQGKSFIGFDLASPTNGFTFTAESEVGSVTMGSSLLFSNGATLKISLPHKGEIKMFYNGQIIAHESTSDRLTLPVKNAGAYRVEVYMKFLGQRRGWIFSNPIYLSSDGIKR